MPVSSNQPSEPSHLPTVKFSNNFPYPHHSYKLHRRISKPIQPQLPLIPSYSNGAVVKIYDQPELLSVQVKRERQRRAMIDRMLTMFDEDGNGHLERDELYSMAIRSHMFPKFHQYLKQTPS